MKNPFTSAIRIADREIDELRRSIGVVLTELTDVEEGKDSLRRRMGRERLRCANEPLLRASQWFESSAVDLAALDRRQHVLSDDLTQLREQAGARIASRRSLEQAAERFRDSERRRLERREQGQSDDRAAARFLRGQAAQKSRIAVS